MLSDCGIWWEPRSPRRPSSGKEMVQPAEALRRAIERGRDREHLSALYSGPSISGLRRVATTVPSAVTDTAAACIGAADPEAREASTSSHGYGGIAEVRSPFRRGGRREARRLTSNAVTTPLSKPMTINPTKISRTAPMNTDVSPVSVIRLLALIDKPPLADWI